MNVISMFELKRCAGQEEEGLFYGGDKPGPVEV